MTTALDVTVARPAVLKILEANPAIPYSVIANEIGVTRERIRQIARQNGYPPRRGILKLKICPVCGETVYKMKKYCSLTCAYKSRRSRVAVNCHQCGKTLERTPGSLRSKNGRCFCDRSCFRKWVDNNHSHEEHK